MQSYSVEFFVGGDEQRWCTFCVYGSSARDEAYSRARDLAALFAEVYVVEKDHSGATKGHRVVV